MNLTDNEIIKAFECCTKDSSHCKECPLEEEALCRCDIIEHGYKLITGMKNGAKRDKRIIKHQSKKIAEQKAEIEWLRKSREELLRRLFA